MPRNVCYDRTIKPPFYRQYCSLLLRILQNPGNNKIKVHRRLLYFNPSLTRISTNIDSRSHETYDIIEQLNHHYISSIVLCYLEFYRTQGITKIKVHRQLLYINPSYTRISTNIDSRCQETYDIIEQLHHHYIGSIAL
jgi:hypothetical protein